MRFRPLGNRGRFPHPVKVNDSILCLVRKYNQPGPRYTSYPTALQFTSAVDKEVLVAEAGVSQAPLSLYFHIPFCETLCWFCGCTTVITLDRAQGDRYVAALIREMELLSPVLGRRRPVAQLHFGGGTPSFLTPEQLNRLGEAIHRHFTILPDAECSVELDPRTVTAEKIRSFRRIGFNRASMGIQDCNPAVQQAIHRLQSNEQNRQTFAWLRAEGYHSINVDLIYGLPRQTIDTFRDTLTEVLSYQPDRYAVFSYAHVPWMKPAQKIVERQVLPSPETKLSLLALVIETLTEAGYLYIGMDHFARPNDELAVAQRERTLHRNFQGYSTRAGLDIAGFGMSAISQTGRTYRQNYKELPEYYAALEKGVLPIERGYILNEEDQRRRTLIMNLMCSMELDVVSLSQKIGVDVATHYAGELASLEEMVADGLLEPTSVGYRVTDVGRLLIRNIAMKFDAYLPQTRGRHSKTI